MCLAIPGKVVEINEFMGKVEVMGVFREVSLQLVPDVLLNDYVLVHAGFAIQIINEEEALKTLEIFKELEGHEIC
jgi:hydrogenase expression/formation protein HypC